VTAVLPGDAIGILGGGQLGRMLTLEARRMGYRIWVMDPDPRCPTAQVADGCIAAGLDDTAAARELAKQVRVVTLDTEHVPAALLALVEETTPVRPTSTILATIQDRLTQKAFLDRLGLPQTPYRPFWDHASLRAAAQTVGTPAILKSRHAGYDGKGQARVEGKDALEEAWEQIGHAPAVLEAVVPFCKELSVILARNAAGEIRFYPVAENVHRHHVLHTTCVPADIAPQTCRQAQALAQTIATAFHYIGVMAVEMFLLPDATLLINEIAPRTHNSGHYTFGACVTSQFEQHLRAVCGLPLGDPSLLRPAVMVNLLGDLWADGSPCWEAVLRRPNAHLHLYGKQRPAPGRKMGHVLLLDEDVQGALQLVDELLTRSLRPSSVNPR
jgi:5-(carboxyamino)imidazole ribonucleotide synthase